MKKKVEFCRIRMVAAIKPQMVDVSNSFVSLARLGGHSFEAPAINVAMVGIVGNDVLGGFYKEKLPTANVHSFSAPIKDGTFWTVIILTTPDAQTKISAYQGTSSTINYDTTFAKASGKNGRLDSSSSSNPLTFGLVELSSSLASFKFVDSKGEARIDSYENHHLREILLPQGANYITELVKRDVLDSATIKGVSTSSDYVQLGIEDGISSFIWWFNGSLEYAAAIISFALLVEALKIRCTVAMDYVMVDSSDTGYHGEYYILSDDLTNFVLKLQEICTLRDEFDQEMAILKQQVYHHVIVGHNIGKKGELGAGGIDDCKILGCMFFKEWDPGRHHHAKSLVYPMGSIMIWDPGGLNVSLNPYESLLFSILTSP